MIRPEILDHLPSTDSAARWSRRDLRMINFLMGNFAWMRRQIRRLSVNGEPVRVLELGAGTGALARSLARPGSSLHWLALDLAPRPLGWPERFDWIQGDLFDQPELPEADLLVANLFLHHFDRPSLARIGARLGTVRHLAISEPARFAPFHLLGFLLRLLAINHVTRHDLHVSIDAGFRPGELPRLLGLDPEHWSSHEYVSPLGAYRLRADRKNS